MIQFWFSAFSVTFFLAIALLVLPSVRSQFGNSFLSDKGIQSLDGLRGLAALWVTVGHMVPFLYTSNIILVSGPKAVAVFAVLSGFLIYGSAAKIQSMEDLRGYVVRRFFRIYPIYALSLLLLLLFFWDKTFTLSRYLGDIFMFRALGSPTFATNYTWSVFPEVLFYGLILAYVPFGLRWGYFASIPAAILLSYCSVYGQLEYRIWQYFFVGIALADFIPKMKRVPSFVGEFVLMVGICLLIVDLRVDWGWHMFNHISHLFGTNYFPDPISQNKRFTFGLGISSAMMIFGAIHSKTGKLLLSTPPLVFLGKISYSLFILHGLILCVYLQQYFDVTYTWSSYSFVHQQVRSVLPFQDVCLILLPSMVLIATVTYLSIEKPLINFSNGKPLFGGPL